MADYGPKATKIWFPAVAELCGSLCCGKTLLNVWNNRRFTLEHKYYLYLLFFFGLCHFAFVNCFSDLYNRCLTILL